VTSLWLHCSRFYLETFVLAQWRACDDRVNLESWDFLCVLWAGSLEKSFVP